MHQKWIRLQMMTGVVAISFSPLAVKMVSFSPTVSAFYRSFYAGLFFVIAALWAGSVKKAFRCPQWLPASIGAGIFLGIDLVVWHKTILYLGAGPATFLGNSQIIFVALFAAFVFREKIRPVYYFFVAVILAGLYLLLPAATLSVSRPAGYFLGLIVGFTYAGVLICLRYAKMHSGHHYPQLLSLGVMYGFSALIAGGYAVFIEKTSLFSTDLRSHGLIAITAFVCQTWGWFLINQNLTRIDAHEVSFLLMLQPVLATLWGCLLFQEPLSGIQLSGMALSLTGILVYQMRFAAKTSESEAKVLYPE